MAFRPVSNEIAEMAKCCSWRSHEISESRVLAANHAPDQSDADDTAEDVPCPGVLRQKIVLREVGHEEQDNQRPVANADDRIPNPNRILLSCHATTP